MISHSVKNGQKLCSRCKALLSADRFSSHAYTTNQGKRSVRISPRCIECSRKHAREGHRKRGEEGLRVARIWKAKNAARAKSGLEAWRANNRDFLLASRRQSEALRRAHGGGRAAPPPGLFKLVLDEARVEGGWLDAYTGDVIQDPTVDHIEPLCAGGGHEYGNLCVTSRANNSRKRTASMLRYLARLKFEAPSV